jgi:hypothetical protein
VFWIRIQKTRINAVQIRGSGTLGLEYILSCILQIPFFSFLGTSTSYSSKDKAGRKQLAWERGREEFMQGNSWRKQPKKHHRKPQQGKKPAAGAKRPPKKKQKR